MEIMYVLTECDTIKTFNTFMYYNFSIIITFDISLLIEIAKMEKEIEKVLDDT